MCSSGGKEREGDLQYYPFRMTPYLMKVQDAELSEEQFCCLLLAERVHSGYEGKAGDLADSVCMWHLKYLKVLLCGNSMYTIVYKHCDTLDYVG